METLFEATPSKRATKRYAYRMDIKGILREIDAEIGKLIQVRSILEGLLEPKPKKAASQRRRRMKSLRHIEVAPEPRVIVLPPKQRREYTRRAEPRIVEPRALATPLSSAPIFVPKAAVPATHNERTAGDDSALEAAMRRKLLGGAA